MVANGYSWQEFILPNGNVKENGQSGTIIRHYPQTSPHRSHCSKETAHSSLHTIDANIYVHAHTVCNCCYVWMWVCMPLCWYVSMQLLLHAWFIHKISGLMLFVCSLWIHSKHQQNSANKHHQANARPKKSLEHFQGLRLHGDKPPHCSNQMPRIVCLSTKSKYGPKLLQRFRQLRYASCSCNSTWLVGHRAQ